MALSAKKGFLPSYEMANGTFPDLVRRCVEIKASFVEEDERETTGSRALLNFGHTLGHAIEAVAGYGTLLHGEAVALGMVAAAQVSAKRAGLQKQEIEELVGLIRQFDLPTKLPERPVPKRDPGEGLCRQEIRESQDSLCRDPETGSALLAENITVEDLESGLQAIDPSQT